MNIKFPGVFKSLFLVLFSLTFILWSCNSNKNKNEGNGDIGLDQALNEDEGSVELDEDLQGQIQTAKTIFYSLPSPLETANHIKAANPEYDETLMNPVSNAENYNTNLEMALNLGIYSTNLSYASLYNQSQATLDYINAAKKMADGLNILDAIDQQTIDRLQENINNRDVIIDIISETLLNSTSFLEDRGLQATSALILVGGWVEGLYIATSLVPEDVNIQDNKLVQLIASQKHSLDIVLNLLNENKESVEVQTILEDVQALKTVYDKISIEQSENTVVEDPTKNITTVRSSSTINISKEVFDELSQKVKEIRTRYIS